MKQESIKKSYMVSTHRGASTYSKNGFFRVIPLELDLKKNRIRRYYHVLFMPGLNIREVKRRFKEIKPKKAVGLLDNPNELIFIRHPDKPLIILDVKNNEILSTKTILKEFSLPEVMHQASYILRFLKGSKRKNQNSLVSFRRRSIQLKLETYGYSKKERLEAYNLMEMAFKWRMERKRGRLKANLLGIGTLT